MLNIINRNCKPINHSVHEVLITKPRILVTHNFSYAEKLYRYKTDAILVSDSVPTKEHDMRMPMPEKAYDLNHEELYTKVSVYITRKAQRDWRG